jgi:hypothetical protein
MQAVLARCVADACMMLRVVLMLLLQEQTDIAWFWSLAGNTSSTTGIWFDIGKEVRGLAV